MAGPKAKILLLEDDPIPENAICNFLESLNFHVVVAKDGGNGLAAVSKDSFGIILLSNSLSLAVGSNVAGEIRKNNFDTPIIFILEKALSEDMIGGFRPGIDDCITKPVMLEELEFRINTILMRSNLNVIKGNLNITYKIGRHTFDYSNHLLISGEMERKLTKREAELLHLLCRNMNSTLRRDIALKIIWGENDYFMGRSMDVYIAKLRKMLSNDPNVSIVNIHNTGFRLETRKPG